MRRLAALVAPCLVLVGLVLPGPALAQDYQPASTGGDVASIDPIRDEWDPELATTVKTRAATFRCWVKNTTGAKIFQLNVRWHWKWKKSYLYPQYLYGVIVGAWHETPYPSSVGYLWSYEGWYHGQTWGAKNGTLNFYGRDVIGHFQATVGPITLNRYLHVDPILWAGGGYQHNCRVSNSL